jgi:hypothetical protein
VQSQIQFIAILRQIGIEPLGIVTIRLQAFVVRPFIRAIKFQEIILLSLQRTIFRKVECTIFREIQRSVERSLRCTRSPDDTDLEQRDLHLLPEAAQESHLRCSEGGRYVLRHCDAIHESVVTPVQRYRERRLLAPVQRTGRTESENLRVRRREARILRSGDSDHHNRD